MSDVDEHFLDTFGALLLITLCPMLLLVWAYCQSGGHEIDTQGAKELPLPVKERSRRQLAGSSRSTPPEARSPQSRVRL